MTPYETKLYFNITCPAGQATLILVPFPDRSYISKLVIGQSSGPVEGFTVDLFNRDPSTMFELEAPPIQTIPLGVIEDLPDRPPPDAVTPWGQPRFPRQAKKPEVQAMTPDPRHPGADKPRVNITGGISTPTAKPPPVYQYAAPEDFFRVAPKRTTTSSILSYFTGDPETGQRPYIFVSHDKVKGNPYLYVRMVVGGNVGAQYKQFGLLVGGETFT